MLSFDIMLDEIYNKLDNKTDIKLKVRPPILERHNKNNNLLNAREILISLKRPSDHIINFMKKELNCVINWDSDKKNYLIFMTKINDKRLMNVINKYIKLFVSCKSCGSCDSIFIEEKDLRTYRFNCNSCKTNYVI